MKLLALCSVLQVTRSNLCLTSTSEIGGPLWLDPENLPFRRRHITRIRLGMLQLKPHMIEESSSGRLEREF
jgi:hypothetical protein